MLEMLFSLILRLEKIINWFYTTGKYALDMFVGKAIFKGIMAIKNLKYVNRICNLKTMVISNANKGNNCFCLLK
ncbi:hypothetical protein PRO82_002291 [Candidatus Protochlamydia amoebophila]|nr:hypothetical protein [Candidatus Protochlamydia amoebophila]